MTKPAAVPAPIKTGRPRSDENADKPRFYETDLYALLLKKLPTSLTTGGRLDPGKIATAIKVNRFTVYRWLTENKVSSKGAGKLIALAPEKLTVKDLAPFTITA